MSEKINQTARRPRRPHKPRLQSPPFTRRWLTVTETADIIGLAPVTVRRMVNKGLIPKASNLGRIVRVDGLRLQAQLEADQK
ncbi:helix-turn-helix domain-containing protein [Candidatus Dependentiae bacterium]|nr:helix-turn-helix domain-containing protein [Candidatus Dependentiae bacterium]